MKKIRLDEDTIKKLVTEFLINKENGNWHEDKIKAADLHDHGVDLSFVVVKGIVNSF